MKPSQAHVLSRGHEVVGYVAHEDALPSCGSGRSPATANWITAHGSKGASKMSENQTTQAYSAETGRSADFDAIVVGAGFAGLYMLHSLRKLGLSVRVYEQGGGVGGTWYWNRYPGARCDSESVYYMFSDHMSEEILGEWNWTERYAAQPEILRYLEFVTDKMDLRRDIQFNAKVISAVYDADRNVWDIQLEDGSTSSARFLVTAVGCLSSTNIPEFRGIETFGGESYHTGAWPHEGVDFTGKRVAVIGTGATAVQAIPEIAKQAAHVWVFQRTPNYDMPGRNRPLAPDYAAQSRRRTRTCGRGHASPASGCPIRWPNDPRWTTPPRNGSASSRRLGPRAASIWAWRRSATSWSTRKATIRSPSSCAARSARSSRTRRSGNCWHPRIIRSSPSGHRWRTATTRLSTGTT